MAKSRFTRDQMKAVVHEAEAGSPVKAVSQKYGVSTTTLYRWRAMLTDKKTIVGDRLQSLEIENRRLKRKFAELSLDYTSLRTALIRPGTKDC